MKWSHLPLEGGIYDQDPRMVDQFEYIFYKVNEKQAQDAAEQRNKAKRK